MALNNAVGSCKWGGYGSDEPYLDNIDWRDVIVNNKAFFANSKNGWENTLKLTQNWPTETCHHSDHEAAMATLNYFNAPTTIANNTGWFLPSAAQWGAVIGREGIGKYSGSLEDLNFSKSAGGDVLDNINFYLVRFENCEPICRGYYFTSNEIDRNNFVIVWFDESLSGWSGGSNNRTYIYISSKEDNTTTNKFAHVRPFLAF